MKKQSERRLAENEAVFRQYNRKVQDGFDAVNATARELGNDPIDVDGSHVLHFYCECSDENCRERIKVSLNEYNGIHASKVLFTIKCGHEFPKFEDVTETHDEYCVVRKHADPPDGDVKLRPTSVDNV